MQKIKSITIVTSVGANSYNVGFTSNGKVISNIERLPRYEDSDGVVFSGKFVVTDKEGNCIAEISDNVPYVVEFE